VGLLRIKRNLREISRRTFMFRGETNKFTPVTFLYDSDGFAIAEGIWHEKKEDSDAICQRWVGKEDDPDDVGYPNGRGGGQWMIVPEPIGLVLKVVLALLDTLKILK
jgi:hypothetical protein